MSKIIKYNIKMETLKAGGGQPEFPQPSNIHGLERMETFARDFPMFLGKNTFILRHKRSSGYDSESRKYPYVPPTTKRFVKSMRILTGDSSLEYEFTWLNTKEIRYGGY